MTAIVKYVPQIFFEIFDVRDDSFNFEKVNKSLVAFFTERDAPIMLDDVKMIEKLSKNLYPFYFTHITQKDGIYEFSIIKNIEYVIQHKYSLDVTVYCNEKIYVNVLVNSDLEYTQYPYKDHIVSVMTIGNRNVTKTFNTTKNKYITTSDDLEQLISNMDIDAHELFDESFPYRVDFLIDERNFCIKYQNDARQFSWKLIWRSDIGGWAFHGNKKYCCFSATQNENVLECMFESNDLAGTIGRCAKLCHFDYLNIKTFDIAQEFLCVSYIGTDVTFLSKIFEPVFDEENLIIPEIKAYTCSLYFTSDFNESSQKGYTMEIRYSDNVITISTVKKGVNIYHYGTRSFSYSIISADPAKKVVLTVILMIRKKDTYGENVLNTILLNLKKYLV